MYNIKLIIAFGAAISLTACGSDSKIQSPAPVVAPPPVKLVDPPKTTYYVPRAPQVGDSYHYKSQPAATAAAPTPEVSLHSLQVASISAAGDYYVNSYQGAAQVLYSSRLYNAGRALLRAGNCDYAPARNDLPLPWYVGEISTQTSQSTCIGGSTGLKTSTRSKVLSYESVTVAAGTFNTIKTQIEISDDTLASIGGTSTQSSTCWTDVISGATVKCTDVYLVHLPKALVDTVYGGILAALIGNDVPRTTTTELVAIQHAADLPYSVTASIAGSVIPNFYLTPKSQQGLIVLDGKSLSLTATQALNWTIKGSYSTATVALTSANQTLSIDGYNINVKIVGGTLTAKLLSTTVPALASYTLTGASVADPTQTVSVIVSIAPNSSIPLDPPLLCSGALKFC